MGVCAGAAGPPPLGRTVGVETAGDVGSIRPSRAGGEIGRSSMLECLLEKLRTRGGKMK